MQTYRTPHCGRKHTPCGDRKTCIVVPELFFHILKDTLIMSATYFPQTRVLLLMFSLSNMTISYELYIKGDILEKRNAQ